MSQGSNLPIGHQAVELELELQESLLSPSSDAHIEQGQRSAMANKFTKSDVRKTDGLAGMVALVSLDFWWVFGSLSTDVVRRALSAYVLESAVR